MGSQCQTLIHLKSGLTFQELTTIKAFTDVTIMKPLRVVEHMFSVSKGRHKVSTAKRPY